MTETGVAAHLRRWRAPRPPSPRRPTRWAATTSPDGCGSPPPGRTGPATIVCVVGEFKQGKSSLVNALLGERRLPGRRRPRHVGDHPRSATATSVEVDVRRRARASRRWSSGSTPALDPRLGDRGRATPSNAQGRRAGRHLGAEPAARPTGSCSSTRRGWAGSARATPRRPSRSCPFADGLVFVSDASAELSAPRSTFLAQARERCPNVVFALTKTDLYPSWRRHRGARRRPPRPRTASDVPTMALSSRAARRSPSSAAIRELDEQSGFPPLLARARRARSWRRPRHLAARRAAAEAVGALDQLEPSVARRARGARRPGPGRRGRPPRPTPAKQRIEHLRGPGRAVDASSSATGSPTCPTTSRSASGTRCARSSRTRRGRHRAAQDGQGLGRHRPRPPDRGRRRGGRRVRRASRPGRRTIRDAVLELLAEDIVDAVAAERRARRSTSPRCGRPSRSTPARASRGKVLGDTLTGLRGAQSGIIMFGMMGQFLPGGHRRAPGLQPGHARARRRVRRHAARRRATSARSPQRRQQARIERPAVLRRRAVRGRATTIGELLRTVQRAIRDEFTERIAELHRTYADAARPATEAIARDAGRPAPAATAELHGGARPARRHRGRARRRRRGAGVSAAGRAPSTRCCELCDLAAELAAGHRSAPSEVDAHPAPAATGRCGWRSPAGSRPGKSTLLNALVGERLAATDAGECTKLVTWYQDGARPTTSQAVGRDGAARAAPVPPRRRRPAHRPRRARPRRRRAHRRAPGRRARCAT